MTEGIFLQAQRLIDKHSSDSDFDVEELAALCALSRRTLSLIYEQQGLRMVDQIRRRRAECAFRALTSGRWAPLSDIASASGFATAKAMSHTLKVVYGQKASEIRSSSTLPGPRPSGSATPVTQAKPTNETGALRSALECAMCSGCSV